VRQPVFTAGRPGHGWLGRESGQARATGNLSQVRYDHYSTARTIEDALGPAPFTANDAYAAPYNDVFTRRGR
jgi:hypothetical protein